MDSTVLGQCFSLLNRRGQAIITVACEQLDISYSEYVILLRLFEAEGRTQDELADFLCLDKAVITRMVKELEKKGLVRREKDLRDKRMKHLYVTDLARALEVKLVAILDTWFGYLFADLSDEEREKTLKVLRSAAQRAATMSPRKFSSLIERRNLR